MGQFGALFLLIALVVCCTFWGAAGHTLPPCTEQLPFRCNNGSCIPRISVCDGHKDCKDGSDEHHCSNVGCQKGEIACFNRRCILLSLICNGIDDCGDGSDEASCQNCTVGLVSCGKSGMCLPINRLCDGHSDCGNGWDETRELCGFPQPLPQSSPACTASEFQCGDRQCIRQAWRCDGSWDCSDGSDEDSCAQDECQVNNGGCSHHCVDQPMGFLCHCPDNMRLVTDSQCEEVDVCLERDVCDQLCVHTNSTLACACHESYHMNPGTGECKAKGDDAQLVFTSSKGVRCIKIKGTGERKLGPGLPGPGPVAALASNSTLYWAEHQFIYRVAMNENPQEAVLLLKVQGSVSGLAVDWIHQLLYWTSIESGSVSIGLLDGLAQRQLITGLNKPSAVAVDPLQGWLFWTQTGSFPKIEKSALNGQRRTSLVTSLIRHPVGLSLDVPRQLLYWVDQATRSISRVNFEGGNRKTVVESNGYLDRPFGLVVFEGFVYWAEEVTHSICRADKHNGKELQVLLMNVTSPRSVVIVHPVLQPNGSSPCGLPGEVCQHQCVVYLRPDGPEFSCVSPEPALNKTQQVPIPALELSDSTFAQILSLITFLSLLLVGIVLWWWREEFRPSRNLTAQSFSLKESQDPLIVQEPPLGLVKETLLKLDLEGE